MEAFSFDIAFHILERDPRDGAAWQMVEEGIQSLGTVGKLEWIYHVKPESPTADMFHRKA